MQLKRLLLCALLALTACLTAEARDLRVAIWDGASPYNNATQDGWSGPCPDIYRAIEALEPQLHFVMDASSMPIRRIEQEMVAGRRDIICGARKTAAREALGLRYLSQGIHNSGYQLAARADDTVKIRNWDDVKKLGNQGIVLILQGHAEIDHLQQMGILLDVGSPSAEQNLVKLEAGRGRFFYARDTYFKSATFNQKEHPNVRVLPVVFDPQPAYIAVGTQVPKEVLTTIDNAFMRLIKSGELRRILRTYNIE